MPISDPGDLKVTSKFYNDIDDPSPGASLSTADVSGSIIQNRCWIEIPAITSSGRGPARRSMVALVIGSPGWYPPVLIILACGMAFVPTCLPRGMEPIQG